MKSSVLACITMQQKVIYFLMVQNFITLKQKILRFWVATLLCLVDISKDWSVDEMKETGLNEYVYDFNVY